MDIQYNDNTNLSKAFITTYRSSASVFMMNNRPTGAKKHRKSTKTESGQTASIQPHITIFNSGRVELCTELFYVIIPTLFPCSLVIGYPYILLHF